MASKTAARRDDIDVYIKLTSGKVVPLNVNSSTTIASLCAQIRGHEASVPAARVALKYQGKVLQKTKTVGEYGVCKETVLRVEILASRKLNIFIKMEDSRSVPLTVESTNTVSELKDMIKAKEGIAPGRQTLKRGDNVLSSALSSLQDCGVEDEAVLKLTVTAETAASSSYLPEKTVEDMDENAKQDVLGSFAASFGADQVVDVVFSFDTTGSMYSCLAEVRRQVRNTVERLLKDIPNIRIGIIAHGDYCDQKSSYVVKQVELTNNTEEIVKFIDNVPSTSGGDSPECYEWVLVKAQELQWHPDSAKALVVIGDALPHMASYTDQDIMWREELVKLTDMGVKVYGVQALNQSASVPFYKELARVSGGKYLKFCNFSLITDMFLAVCYGASCPQQLQAYQLEVETEGRMTDELGKVFEELTKDAEKPEEDEEEDEPQKEADSATAANKDTKKKAKNLDTDFSSPNAVRQAWWSRDCDTDKQSRPYKYKKKADEWHQSDKPVASSTSSTATSFTSSKPVAAPKKTSRMSLRKRSQSTSKTTRRKLCLSMEPLRQDIRMAVLGVKGVGKDSLTRQFTEKAFTGTASAHTSVQRQKNMDVSDHRLALNITTCAEQSGFGLETCFRSNESFLVIYSVSDRSSLADAQALCEKLAAFYSPEIPILLVGNKSDVEKSAREVQTKEGDEAARRVGPGCKFLEVSARDFDKTEKVFKQLLRQALDARESM